MPLKLATIHGFGTKNWNTNSNYSMYIYIYICIDVRMSFSKIIQRPKIILFIFLNHLTDHLNIIITINVFNVNTLWHVGTICQSLFAAMPSHRLIFLNVFIYSHTHTPPKQSHLSWILITIKFNCCFMAPHTYTYVSWRCREVACCSEVGIEKKTRFSFDSAGRIDATAYSAWWINTFVVLSMN